MEPTYTILIVDDEQVVRDAARRILAARGFVLHTVGDAEEALVFMQTTVPNVLLVDLMLPGLSGLALLEQVRRRYPDVVVIVMTGYTSIDHALDSLHRGAFDFLPKPFTFNELLGPIYRACRYLDLQKQAPLPFSEATPTAYYRLGIQAWAKLEDGGTALLGITDVFARTVGQLVRVEYADVNGPVQQGGLLARFEAEDQWVHMARAALSGRVLAINPRWKEEPNQAICSAQEEQWIVRILPVNLERECQVLSTL